MHKICSFINNSQYCILIKKFLLSGWPLIISLLIFGMPLVKAQPDNGNPIRMDFVKDQILLPSAGSFFNVVRIENHSSESFEGLLWIGKPEGWNLLGNQMNEVSINPGDTSYVPVRISMPMNTKGNVSYIVSAEIRGKDQYSYANSYISLQPHTNWDMRVKNKELFLSEFRNTADFYLELENRGNVDQLIRLNFAMGGLLRLHQALDNDSILFIELPAYSDTLLRFDVSMKKDLTYSQQKVLERNWRSTSIYLNASSENQELFSGLKVTPLESYYYNEMPLRNSPLNAELNLYNLLSFHRPRMTARIHGKLFFPEQQMLNYTLGFNNIYFNRVSNMQVDFYQQFRYMVNYQDKRTVIRIADRLSTGILHSLSGNGVETQYRLNENTFTVGAVQNPYARNYGFHSGISAPIGRTRSNTGITVESTRDNRYNHYSLHLGSTYNILSRHRFRIQTVTSLSNFSSDRFSANDTSTVGFAYRIGYQLKGSRFNLRLDNMNTRLSYLRNSGINRIDGYLNYTIGKDARLQAYYNRNSYLISRYPYNFFFPGNLNLNENARVYMSHTKGNIIYQYGPQFVRNEKNYYNPATGTMTKYKFYQPGLVASTTFRLGSYRSITPNVSLNLMRFDYSPLSTQEDDILKPWNWQYTAGVNYYDHALKINAYYTSGESSDLYRSAVVSGEPVINQAIHIRPFYERYLARETIKLSAFYNYSFYMPSERENTLINLSSEFYLRKGTNIFTSFNVYKTSRNDPETGLITNRSLNIMVGIRKAFDVQQPNYKHHDLKLTGFNDQDGDRKKSENEKPVSNILVNISRDPLKNEKINTGFSEINMITDPNGEIFYGKIPEGVYDLRLTPLSSLEDRFFLEGEKQTLVINDNLQHSLPLIESYTIRGKIQMDRDPNSSEGRINLEGVRITATSVNGDTYSTLTNSSGGFTLNLPMASVYKVSIINVFGEHFLLERGEYEVQFAANRIIELDFVFRERRRQIRFQEGEQFFEFNINNNKN